MGRASENTGNADIADFDPLSPKGTVYIQNTQKISPSTHAFYSSHNQKISPSTHAGSVVRLSYVATYPAPLIHFH